MHNINPSEVQKFDQISSHWWDPHGPFKPLHDINPIRLKFILQVVGAANHLKILDVGCGGGILSEAFAKLNFEVTGIDASLEAIKVAKQHAENNHLLIQYFQTTVEQFVTPSFFDVVVCMELLEHVPDPLSVIQACARLVKPGGFVFLSTLNRTLKSFLFAIVGAEYILGWLPKGTHDYAKFIRPSELQKMAIQAKLSFSSIKGISYQPLSCKYELSENVDVNYMVGCTPFIQNFLE